MLERNALKAVGAALAVIALCTPLIFWPTDDAQTWATELSQATVTVPPTVIVTTTLPPGATTSTTEASTAPTSTTTNTEPPISITMAAVGDVLTQTPILNSAKNQNAAVTNSWQIFAPAVPYLSAADYTVADLEPPLAGSAADFSGCPRFNSPVSLAYALRMAGIDLVATANNHSLDMGWEGIVCTLDRLDTAGLAHVGTYRSPEERASLIVDI